MENVSKKKKKEIFEKLLVDFSFIGFKKELDKALGMFLEENMTFENKKTMIDFSVIDFVKWVSDKEKSK